MEVTYYTDGSGWVYTGDMRPGDRMATTEEVQAQLGDPVENIIAEYDTRIDQRLEDFARAYYSKGYANAVTYKDSAVPEWRREAEYLIEARDATWLAAYAYLNEVLPLVTAGERDVPSWEDVQEHLPVLAWPEGTRGYAGA